MPAGALWGAVAAQRLRNLEGEVGTPDRAAGARQGAVAAHGALDMHCVEGREQTIRADAINRQLNLATRAARFARRNAVNATPNKLRAKRAATCSEQGQAT